MGMALPLHRRLTKHARRVRHPCRNAIAGNADRGGVGKMNHCSTLVGSVGGGVGPFSVLIVVKRTLELRCRRDDAQQ